MKNAASWFSKWPFDLRDLHVYGGLAMVGGGLYMLNPAWALIAVGAVLTFLGVWRMT